RTEDFKVKLGPLPDQPEIIFKALQHYADGQVVRWIQDPSADADRPAAALDLDGGGVGGTPIDNIEPDEPSTNAAVVAGGIVVIVLVIVAMLLLVTRRRRRDI